MNKLEGYLGTRITRMPIRSGGDFLLRKGLFAIYATTPIRPGI